MGQVLEFRHVPPNRCAVWLKKYYAILMLIFMLLQTLLFGICVWLDWLILCKIKAN